VLKGQLTFRPYQLAIFRDNATGILIIHWSRQIGKSFVLAAWAVDRLLTRPGRLVTVLSNSRDNGGEFAARAGAICTELGAVFETMDDSPDATYENMRFEVRIKVGGKIGRIKVLAANPRTARGFSGDLILDEFAFHENSSAIWEAAEPILSSNRDYLCRIASTGNGKYNMFHRMTSGAGPQNGEVFTTPAGFRLSRVTRQCAYEMGVPVYDPNTREEITPDVARSRALDKRAYDQNYECKFNDENMCLLTNELIQQALRDGIPMNDQSWSAVTIARLFRAEGDLFLGQDVGRNRDLSVIIVLERQGQSRRVLGVLRMAGMRLPDQQNQLELICRMPKFRGGCIDMTGLGLGLVEFSQAQSWGRARIAGVNFACTEPINDFIRAEGRKQETARVTENMATALLKVFEDRSLTIEVLLDSDAIEDLRKPERITTPGGRTSIAATRTESGHADHFWALALAVRAAEHGSLPVSSSRVTGLTIQHNAGNLGMGRLKVGSLT
jgi:phage FluMu gp28-like protein